MSYRAIPVHEWTCDRCGLKAGVDEPVMTPPPGWRTEEITDTSLGLFAAARHYCPECAKGAAAAPNRVTENLDAIKLDAPAAGL